MIKNQDGLRLSNMTRICDPPSLQFCIPLLLIDAATAAADDFGGGDV